MGLLGASAVAAIVVVGCGDSSSDTSSSDAPTSASGATGASDTSQDDATTALVSSCVGYYNDGVWGSTEGADPTSYCECVISDWLSSGESSAEDIAAAMETSATDSGGVPPIGFDQQFCNGDPTIDPTTGIPN